MYLNTTRILQTVAGATMAVALAAVAQTPAPATPAPTPAPAPTWSVGPMDLSGFIDGYYSFNFNRPNSNDGLGDQVNQLYNFNDKTDQFNLSAAKLTFNHDADPIGAHVDFVYGRTNEVINNAPTNSTSGAGQLPYLEQAFVSIKPPKAKGFELDFGKFVTSAGAEVIEAKDNWNYSRSLLFVNAIPYWHFGARTSMPVSKSETIGFQVFNGWNNISKSQGGVSGAVTSAFVKPKASWFLNYLVGPENYGTTTGLRNLIDSTLLLTPPGKVNAYLNFDYGQNATPTGVGNKTITYDWWGAAGALHAQATAKSAISLRAEYFKDAQGFATGTTQHLYEGTATYEYKWVEGLLTRVEYRIDESDQKVFYTQAQASPTKTQQQTLTVSFIAFFGPKR